MEASYNAETVKLFKAVEIIKVNGMESSKSNMAKLIGWSRPKVDRQLKNNVIKLGNLLLPRHNRRERIATKSTLKIPSKIGKFKTPSRRLAKHRPHASVQALDNNYTLLCSPMGARSVTSVLLGEWKPNHHEVLLGSWKLPVIDNVSNEINLTNEKEDIMTRILITNLNVALCVNKLLAPQSNYDKRQLVSKYILECFRDISRSKTINSKSTHYHHLVEHDKKYSFTVFCKISA